MMGYMVSCFLEDYGSYRHSMLASFGWEFEAVTWFLGSFLIEKDLCILDILDFFLDMASKDL